MLPETSRRYLLPRQDMTKMDCILSPKNGRELSSCPFKPICQGPQGNPCYREHELPLHPICQGPLGKSLLPKRDRDCPYDLCCTSMRRARKKPMVSRHLVEDGRENSNEAIVKARREE
ncbi:hypothetical protein AMTR_s00086p00034250 [Amborella trichopoda]|uniref:Uncharacterized protein n=1 Tax=Amborella trichopoda TaxID=13333 RepID=W1P5B0_AMBTC|nr:hypothetical protein AMTR_s00086p00034250 [Amborella trichopoda]